MALEPASLGIWTLTDRIAKDGFFENEGAIQSMQEAVAFLENPRRRSRRLSLSRNASTG
jgi:hypothetical protein